MYASLTARGRRYALALVASLAVAAIALAQPARPGARQRPGTKPPTPPPSGPKDAKLAGALDEKLKFVVDKKSKRNTVAFISKTTGMTINGKTTGITGEITVNPAKLDSIEGKFTVPWKSLDTGKQKMNEHMMTSPWVDAEAHPDIVFTITGIEELKAGKTDKYVTAKLVGKMAMNGVEKDMTVPVTITWFGSPKDKEGLGIKSSNGKFKINLADYKIVGREVGKKVAATLEINVSVVVRRADTMTEDEGDEEKAEGDKPKPPPNS